MCVCLSVFFWEGCGRCIYKRNGIRYLNWKHVNSMMRVKIMTAGKPIPNGNCWDPLFAFHFYPFLLQLQTSNVEIDKNIFLFFALYTN